MININIVNLLQKNGKSKYWLCKNMNITSRNLNRIINNKTTAISFKYIEDLCFLLKCSPGELITITKTNTPKEYETN